jgi:hypothetical protein
MPRLFSDESLAEHLNEVNRRVAEHLAHWDHDKLLATPDEDVVDRLVEIAEVHCPALGQRMINTQLDTIEKWLGFARTQLDPHNAGLRGGVERQVAARKAKILDARNLQAAIGFPLQRREDADTYAAPEVP